jgi:hypothetical protein
MELAVSLFVCLFVCFLFLNCLHCMAKHPEQLTGEDNWEGCDLLQGHTPAGSEEVSEPIFVQRTESTI